MIKFLTIFLLFPFLVFAVPIDTLEGYSVAGWNGNGGNDDANQCNWGGTTWSCDASYDIVSTPTQTGVRAGHGNSSAGACTRVMNQISDSTVLTSYIRAAQTTIRDDNNWQTQTAQIIDYGFGPDGQLRALNNGTWDNIQAYNTNQWYKIEVKVTSFSGKTYQIAVDGGAFSADKTFANNSSATYLDVGGFDVAGAGDFYFDDIGSGTNCPVAAATPPELDDSTWFQILRNWFINKVYAYE